MVLQRLSYAAMMVLWPHVASLSVMLHTHKDSLDLRGGDWEAIRPQRPRSDSLITYQGRRGARACCGCCLLHPPCRSAPDAPVIVIRSTSDTQCAPHPSCPALGHQPWPLRPAHLSCVIVERSLARGAVDLVLTLVGYFCVKSRCAASYTGCVTSLPAKFVLCWDASRGRRQRPILGDGTSLPRGEFLSLPRPVLQT